MASGKTAQTVPFRHLLGIRSFMMLYIAEIQSIVGDQLARFALSVLVFDRTGSATASALTYAVSFLPGIAGGFVLARLGDRFDRRLVMVTTDLVRAALFVAMVAPGLPIGLVVTILAVAVFLGPAFTSAQVSYLAAVLEPEEFRTATALRSASNQLAQVLGFAIGGIVVFTVSARGALLVDAATFVASALLVAAGLSGVDRRTPTVDPAQTREHEPVDASGLGAPFGGLWRDARTRLFMGLTVAIGLFVLPEALAVPFGDRIGANVAETGVLVSMIPLGSAVGAALIVRVPSQSRRRVASGMAVGCGVPLLVSAANPPWPVACVCWFVSGVLAAYQVEAIAALVNAIPDSDRSRLFGVVGAWLLGAQGVGFAVGGLLTQALGPGSAIALAALAGIAVALTLTVADVRRRVDDGRGARTGLV